jgi:aminocarboxymuconate-semialdehyde decarboxylase
MERIVGPVSEQAVCFPSEMGLAVASMITGGMSERHPNLRIAFSHGGGVTAMLMGRLDRAYDIIPKFSQSLPQKPSAYAKRFYYDSIVFDPENLAHILKTFGTTQVLVGSDYPFAMGDPDPVKFLNRCSLEPGVMRAICCDNALRFLGRPV